MRRQGRLSTCRPTTNWLADRFFFTPLVCTAPQKGVHFRALPGLHLTDAAFIVRIRFVGAQPVPKRMVSCHPRFCYQPLASVHWS